jgi:hypothetical protein
VFDLAYPEPKPKDHDGDYKQHQNFNQINAPSSAQPDGNIHHTKRKPYNGYYAGQPVDIFSKTVRIGLGAVKKEGRHSPYDAHHSCSSSVGKDTGQCDCLAQPGRWSVAAFSSQQVQQCRATGRSRVEARSARRTAANIAKLPDLLRKP